MLFLLLGELREFGIQRMIRQKERFLAVKNRRIRAGLILQTIDLTSSKRELHASKQCGVWITFEIRIGEIGTFSRMAMKLDQIGTIDLAEMMGLGRTT